MLLYQILSPTSINEKMSIMVTKCRKLTKRSRISMISQEIALIFLLNFTRIIPWTGIYCFTDFHVFFQMRHKPICAKSSSKKRKVFDTTKQRIEGTEIKSVPKARANTQKVRASVQNNHNSSTTSGKVRCLGYVLKGSHIDWKTKN